MSPSDIAPTGHSSIHVPHAIQSSEITCAIFSSFKLIKINGAKVNDSVDISKKYRIIISFAGRYFFQQGIEIKFLGLAA